MRLWMRIQKVVTCFMVISFFFFSGIVAPAHAALVDTAQILSVQKDALARQKVARFLEREDVIDQFEAWGVSASEARARVDAMTPEEIQMLSARIDQMPAGGDALGFIVGVAVVTFVVLIITDIMGVTDVFTFIKKR